MSAKSSKVDAGLYNVHTPIGDVAIERIDMGYYVGWWKPVHNYELMFDPVPTKRLLIEQILAGVDTGSITTDDVFAL